MADRRPGLMARLSHLIIVQVVFVFGALALIIFYPGDQGSWTRNMRRLETHLKSSSPELLRVMSAVGEAGTDPQGKAIIEAVLEDVLAKERSIVTAHLRVYPPTGSQLDCRYLAKDVNTLEVSSGMIDDERLWSTDMPGRLILLDLDEDRILYSYAFHDETGLSAQLVFVWRHDLVVSDRSALAYALLILFLGATLSALLMVYLIVRRFNRPYRRLLHGLERTARGDLYYEIEADGEDELDRLRTAFNQMSRTLWDDHRKLKQYDHRLKNATVSLEESQLLLGTIIENSPVGIVASDLDGDIMTYNRKASELFGYTAEAALGRPIDFLFDRSVAAQADAETAATKDSGFEIVGRREDGSHFPAYLISVPLSSGDGSPLAHMYMVRDITESKQFQEMMIRLDRFYNRGRMAGEIGHEINNHLSVLSGNLELLSQQLRDGASEKTERNLCQMRDAVERICRFSNGLTESELGGQDEAEHELCDVNQMVENVAAFLKPQKRFNRVTIDTQLSAKVPLVRIIAGQIQQVLVNLVDNAAESITATGGEGAITIATSTTVLDGKRAAQIEVIDDGPGLANEDRKRLFVDRFTTKAKGHGIGLVTCAKIVAGHGGKISYAYDDGAIFTVCLPTSQVPDQQSETPLTAPGAATRA